MANEVHDRCSILRICQMTIPKDLTVLMWDFPECNCDIAYAEGICVAWATLALASGKPGSVRQKR